jgi:hypothetical protein
MKREFLLLFGIIFSAHSLSFELIKPKGELKQLIEANKARVSSRFSNTPKAIAQENEIKRRINQKILGLSKRKADNYPFPEIGEGRLSAIWEKILDIVGTNYNEIGEAHAGPLVYRHTVGGDSMNFSGFSWQKPEANFSIGVHRDVAPELGSIDQWIVQDQFLLTIDATTLLSNLADLDLIDISEEALAAFVGIGYQRQYRSYHYAESYVKGLSSDFFSLFLPFVKFNKNRLFDEDVKVMKKKDIFLFNAGGFVSSPPWYGATLRGGVVVSIGFSNEVTLSGIGPLDYRRPGEVSRISIEKEVNRSASAHLQAQLDFFKLLQFTILSADLEYSYGKSSSTSLSFYEQDQETIRTSKKHKQEVRKLIRGSEKAINLWSSNIIEHEERIKENLNSQYNLFLFGKMKKKQTESTTIIRDGVETIFFTHYSEAIKIIQNFWLRIFNSIFLSLFDFDTGVKNNSELSKRVKIDYFKGENDTEVSGTEDFSVALHLSFFAKNTHKKFWHKKNRNTALYYLESFTDISGDIRRMVRNRELIGPMTVTSSIFLEKEAFNYFHNRDENVTFARFIDMCKVKSKRQKEKWLDPQERRKMIRFGKGGNACVKKLGKRYLKYFDHIAEYGKIDMIKFKKFIEAYFDKARSLVDIQYLFNQDNLFVTGNIDARTKKNKPFTNYFSTGQFRGLGVIDTFKSGGSIRGPASIGSE